MSIVKCHESHYVGVLDNPPPARKTRSQVTWRECLFRVHGLTATISVTGVYGLSGPLVILQRVAIFNDFPFIRFDQVLFFIVLLPSARCKVSVASFASSAFPELDTGVVRPHSDSCSDSCHCRRTSSC